MGTEDYQTMCIELSMVAKSLMMVLVRMLEEVVIRMLFSNFFIKASRRDSLTGVWVGLARVHGFTFGDSLEESKWREFGSRLTKLLSLEQPWTLILDDELANSLIAPLLVLPRGCNYQLTSILGDSDTFTHLRGEQVDFPPRAISLVISLASTKSALLKWLVTEAYKKIAEIQGFLESSIQRSSCERDICKDMLFLYQRQGTIHLPPSTIGLANPYSFLVFTKESRKE